MPRKPETVCFICKSTENVIITFPTNKELFEKWIQILEIKKEEENITANSRKKLCIQHFDPKWHSILLKSTRGPYIFPDPPSKNTTENRSANNNIPTQNSIKRTISPQGLRHNKKPVDYELLLKIKNDEILDLTNKLSALKLQNEAVTRENESLCKKTQQINDLPLNSRTFVNLLLSGNNKNKRYEKKEKQLCQSLYYKNPGSYKFWSETLDNKLPSKGSLLRWQTFRSLPIGVVSEMVAYLKEVSSTLNVDSRKVVLILDEMDGRRSLVYDESQDCILGFETLAKTTKKIAKKFLTVMIRGINGALGNLIIANYATENGITGMFTLKIRLFLFFIALKR